MNQKGQLIDAARAQCHAITGNPITTSTLALRLYLGDAALGSIDGIAKALLRYAETELADCATRGLPVERMMNGRPKIIRPWLWHASDGRAIEPDLDSRVAALEQRLTALEGK